MQKCTRSFLQRFSKTVKKPNARISPRQATFRAKNKSAAIRHPPRNKNKHDPCKKSRRPISRTATRNGANRARRPLCIAHTHAPQSAVAAKHRTTQTEQGYPLCTTRKNAPQNAVAAKTNGNAGRLHSSASSPDRSLSTAFSHPVFCPKNHRRKNVSRVTIFCRFQKFFVLNRAKIEVLRLFYNVYLFDFS